MSVTKSGESPQRNVGDVRSKLKLLLEREVFSEIFPRDADSFFEDGSLIVEFSDEGGGVTEEELELITEKLKGGSNAEGNDGFGIGLSSSHIS